MGTQKRTGRASSVTTVPHQRQNSASKSGQDENSAPLDLAPHSREAEEAVLGAILMNPKAIYEIATFLKPDDFFILRHDWIYEAMLRLHGRGEAIDHRTLAEELRAQERLEEIGGEAYLNYLPTTVPTALHADVYGHIVERAAVRRRLLGAAGEIARLAHDEELPSEQVIEQAEQAIMRITGRLNASSTIPARVAVSRYFDELEERRSDPDKAFGIPSGFRELDEMLGGLHGGDLIYVAGRPGMGKSAWLLNVARNASRQAKARIAIFSMEMGCTQLIERLMAIETGINSRDLRLGKIADDEWAHVVAATGRLSTTKLFFDDSPSLSPQQLRAKCKRLYQEHGLDMIVVDYVQLMHDGGAMGRGSKMYQQVTYISRALKELARELNVPVLAAAQLSRAVEQRQDKRPMLSDLKESGALEQDADVVLFLYRDEIYNPATEFPGEAELIVAKHRNGPTGLVVLKFDKSLTRFRNMRRLRSAAAPDVRQTDLAMV